LRPLRVRVGFADSPLLRAEEGIPDKRLAELKEAVVSIDRLAVLPFARETGGLPLLE
jgi:hypothetical protein